MRILTPMVVRNEADRYLQSCILWLRDIVDGISIYDDQSEDETVEIAKSLGCQVKVRPDDIPSFLQHEGSFRQGSWGWFEEALNPELGDWVLAMDADEFLLSSGDERTAMENQIALTENSALVVRVPEVWALEETPDGFYTKPQVRIDGYWGTIAGTRLFRYQPNGVFKDRPMGCGSEPTYLAPPYDEAEDLFIMHLGYADPEDQKAKFQRYQALIQSGHASEHVRSIVEPPELRPWGGPWVDTWRGKHPFDKV